MTIRPIIAACLAALLIAVSGGPATAADLDAAAARTETTDAKADRRILVMLKLGASHYRAGADYAGGGYGDAVGQAARRRMAAKIARDNHLELVDNWPMSIVGVDCVIMIVPDNRALDVVTAKLSKLPGVAWSQPLNAFHMEAATRGREPNDRLFAAQPAAMHWQLADLHRFATGRGVTIAVVDSRIDATHPDLAGQLATGANFVTDDRQMAERHGTGVAGIIAARANNTVGIAGVAPGARVMGLRACWETRGTDATMCDSISLAKALTYAIERRADIINMSLSGPNDRLLATLIGIAMSRGIAIVAAVDQSRPDNGFPASIRGVIPVADESLSAPRVGVYIAPGLDVPTTEPGGKWYLVNGSSYAAAHVSGLVALIDQVNHGRGTQKVTTALGRSGAIDACAVLSRATALIDGRCATRN